MWLVLRPLSLAVAVFATSAMADGPVVAVKGAAPAVCYFSPAQSGSASNMTLGSASAGQVALMINQLVDPATAQLQPASIALSLNGICNNAHTFLISRMGAACRQRAARRLALPTASITAQASCGGGTSGSLQTSGAAGQSSSMAVVPGRLPERCNCKSVLRPAARTGFRCLPALTPTPSP